MTTDLIDRLAQLPDAKRRAMLAKLGQPERLALWKALEFRTANPWRKYLGNPVGFVERGLGETTWSLQREVMQSVVEHKRTSVPACHAPGKTHLAARVAAYWIAVHPVGTARVITTATTFRQVKALLWPHIRSLHKLHELVGTTSATEWRAGDQYLAEGVKPPDDAEAGISGYHAPHLLIIIDEAGGIKKTYGQSIEALMTGVDTRLLVLGNPPVSGDSTWFETISASPLYNTIPIPYDATPNFTGEETGNCKSCPPEVEPHKIAQHLIDVDWVENLAAEFGKDSAWFRARAGAEFVHDSANKTLPMDWLNEAQQRAKDPGEDEPDDEQADPIKLGCDIAADGGDEFAIAKLDGWTASIVHTSKGAANANAPLVAAKIAEHIATAEAEHARRGIPHVRVQVKIDAIGIGWGVAGILQQWEAENKFRAHIVPVNVAKKARQDKKFANQRAEMWWNMRALIEPGNPAGGLLRLDIDNKELAQLNTPMHGADSTNRITIEKKADMKKRGKHSPDRAEALLLALYEPPGGDPTDLTAVVVGQSNPWATI